MKADLSEKLNKKDTFVPALRKKELALLCFRKKTNFGQPYYTNLE
jgi:hypothetical protein